MKVNGDMNKQGKGADQVPESSSSSLAIKTRSGKPALAGNTSGRARPGRADVLQIKMKLS